MSVKTVPEQRIYVCDGCRRKLDSNGGYAMHEVTAYWTVLRSESEKGPQHFCPKCWLKMTAALVK